LRQNVTHVLISPAIIKQVHQIAEAEEMLNGLKIENRVNNVLYNHACIAGVDYENDAPFNDEPNNDDGEYDKMNPDEIEGLAYNPTRINQEHHEHDDDQEEQYLEDYSDDNDDNDGNDDNAEPQNEGEADDNIDEYADINEDDEPDTEVNENVTITCSGKVSRAPQNLSLQQLTSNPSITEQYTLENARVIAKVMSLMNMGVNQTTVKKNYQFTQTFSLSRGMKKFGEKGCQAAVKEMEQLHERNLLIQFTLMTLQQLKRNVS
jgi:hypothetical protein